MQTQNLESLSQLTELDFRVVVSLNANDTLMILEGNLSIDLLLTDIVMLGVCWALNSLWSPGAIVRV